MKCWCHTRKTSFFLHLAEDKTWRPKVRRSSQSSISSLSIQHDHREHRKLSSNIQPDDHLQNPITCDRSHKLYDWCHLRLPTIMDPATATFFPSTISPTKPPLITQKIKPYPRKTDTQTMSRIREITLTTSSPKSTTLCQVNHETPALVFSTGGFTGNFCHDFSEGFIPLFITLNTIFPDTDVTLVITNYSDWWYEKYEPIIPMFTKQRIVNLDNQTVTHCFPSVVAGLITHGPMTIRPELNPKKKGLSDFRKHLEAAYNSCPAWPAPKVKGRPRMVVVSRAGEVGRVVLNQEELIRAAQEEGFEVVVFEPTPFTYLCQIYRLINSSHVMVGVHGAALTHALFLLPGAVLIQVVPLGNDWLANAYYRKVAKGVGLEYMEYKVSPGESSLVRKYGVDHELVRDAMNVAGRNWSALHNVYLKGQDLRLDVSRLRGYLRRAYSKAKRLMEEQGLRVRRRSRLRTYVKPLVYS